MQRESRGQARSPRHPTRVPAGRWRPLGAVAAVAILLSLAWPSLVGAVDGEITSEGPLTRIIVTPDLNCQVAHRVDASFEFFGADLGACGTFLAVGGSLYGPAAVPSGDFGGSVAWRPVSQQPAMGSGRGGDPFRLVTTVDAGDAGLRIEQTDSYEVGKESYRTDIRISNSGQSEQRAIVYRAGDCYLQDSDTGFGRVDRGAPACVISQASDARIEQWVPITSGSHYFEGLFTDVWHRVASRQPFPDECICDQNVDNGGGLSWELVIPAGGRVDVAHETFFSPEGRNPSVTFADSVSGPADISLDPVVIASSAAIAAGVVVFMPFPAALFNSTLQEHYAEVTAAVTSFRGWLYHLIALGFARVRRAVSNARSRRAGSAVNEPARATGLGAQPRGRGFTLDEAFWKSPLGILAFVLVSALLNGLLDPTFGFAVESVATFLGLAVGLGAMLLAFAIPLFIGTRGLKVGMSARALPGTLLIAVVCVLISRIANFQPGYLYGLIIGFTFSRELSKAESGKLDAVAAGCALGLAVVAWFLLPVVRGVDGTSSSDFGNILLQTAFASIVTAGLEAAAISMLPLRFLPGEKVRDWNRRVWIALLGFATFGFCHVLLNPSSGYLADATRTSLFTVVWLLAIFGGGSVLFWAYFRFRSRPETGASPPSVVGEPPATA